MKMTLSITNKLVEHLLHENKCFFHVQLRLKCEKFHLLTGWTKGGFPLGEMAGDFAAKS